MKISYNWLKHYLNFSQTPEELSEILTNIGLEVEALEKIETIKGGLKGIVIGEVKTCQKHPDADKLSVTTVDIGQEELLNIVCGAPNVAAGQKVLVATIGSKLYFNDEEVTIKKAKLRGQLSEGMICSEDELGLGKSHEGIVVLSPDVTIGTAAAQYFNIQDDYQFEIGLTPNRIDAASHFGVARDLAAYLNLSAPTKAVLPSVHSFAIDNKKLLIPVEVENSTACPRYSAITISNVKVTTSPDWLQNRLRSIGLTPINNIVDITNFVLHEIGQPLHAFDADKVIGKKVVVKTLADQTAFTTLDGVERKLNIGDLMICNMQEGMCIAGVFGGAKSGVTEETKNIFLESAYFNPVWVRKTAKRHGLSTDASFRYERGADPNITVWALKRAAMLIKEIAGGEISSDIVDVYPHPIADYSIELDLNRVKSLIGKNIPKDTIIKILEGLDILVVSNIGDKLKVQVPAYRVDVQREADVVEEILRIYGYNNIEVSDKVEGSLAFSTRPDRHRIINLISDTLSANGMNEIMCNSLTHAAYYNEIETYPAQNIVKIINPLSTDLNGMRQTLLFGGLESINYNINRKKLNLKLYEWGNCYYFNKAKSTKEKPLKAYSETFKLAIWETGFTTEESWAKEQETSTFFHTKGLVENIFKRIGIHADLETTDDVPSDIFEYGIAYKIKDNAIAYVGKVTDKIAKAFHIKQPIYFAEINWDRAFDLAKGKKVQFSEIPRYPEVRRDLALLIDKNVTFAQIKEIAEKVERKLIKSINLFDVYQGKNIEEGKKSYAVSFMLQDETKTLNDKQIDKTMQNLMNAFDKELGAKIR
ncbi:MAG: phenylalanine--tRNA ligase subunit beta [Bacteroidales bacterium]|nr:phenylalanine--tRNA ligase subunit beta [Bacteroidales bacterium]